MRRWGLNHSKDGYGLSLETGPWWAFAAERGAEYVDIATGHMFCGGSGLYGKDWVWSRTFTGKYIDPDSDAALDDSIAGAVQNFGQRALGWYYKFVTHEGRMIHLTNEQAERLDKHAYDSMRWLEFDDDNNEVTDV